MPTVLEGTNEFLFLCFLLFATLYEVEFQFIVRTITFLVLFLFYYLFNCSAPRSFYIKQLLVQSMPVCNCDENTF